MTRNGAANFAPFMLPNGQQIIFASNLHDPRGRSFALYLVNVDGSGLERVMYADGLRRSRCSRGMAPGSSSAGTGTRRRRGG